MVLGKHSLGFLQFGFALSFLAIDASLQSPFKRRAPENSLVLAFALTGDL
jgi:hypothetical protein